MAWPENVTKADLEIRYSRGSGPGGQKRNKTESRVQMHHIPTGVRVSDDSTRSQADNRTLAFRKLAVILVPMMQSLAAEDRPRREICTEVVRTYRQKDHRVRDLRLGGVFNYESVLDGDGLGVIIQQLLERPDPSPSA